LDFPHKPDLMGICFLDFDESNKPSFTNINKFDFSDETKNLLRNDFSLNNFLDKFAHLVNLKS